MFGLRRWAVALESDVVGHTRFKCVSAKKLSVRKRGSFVDKAESVKFLEMPAFDVCPIDHLPCEYGKEFISSCDDVMVLTFPAFASEGLHHCFRAVKVPK